MCGSFLSYILEFHSGSGYTVIHTLGRISAEDHIDWSDWRGRKAGGIAHRLILGELLKRE